MAKRITKIILSIILIYAVLTLLLFLVESIPGQGTEGGIRNFGDAAWYLLATLTTVGYGDVTPATGAGKFIGAIMMISSAGILTFVLGLLFSLFFGRLLPRFNLWVFRHREWYVFTSTDDRSRFLAEQLSKDSGHSIFIFCSDEPSLPKECFSSIRRNIVIDAPPLYVLKRQAHNASCHLFCMGMSPWENYDLALSLKRRRPGMNVYCESPFAPDKLPEGIILFNRPDNAARSYWLDNPIDRYERRIILIGNGELARRLLERGLLTNVFFDDHMLEYHVFGDWDDFKNEHYELGKTLSINEVSDKNDCIIFEDSTWNASAPLLSSADRILLCDDDESVNLSIMNKLLKFFPVQGRVHICAPANDERCTVFGTNPQVLNRAMVMKDSLNHIAMTMNNIYCSKTGGGSSWEMLSEFHRQSNIAAADHLLTKIRLLLDDDSIKQITGENCARAFEAFRSLDAAHIEACRMLEHRRWMRFHILYNWSYDPVRDNKLRHHTLLVPYSELDGPNRELDDSAWEILGEIKKHGS